MFKLTIMKMNVPRPITFAVFATSFPEAQHLARQEMEQPGAVGYKIEDDAGKIVEKWGAV